MYSNTNEISPQEHYLDSMVAPIGLPNCSSNYLAQTGRIEELRTQLPHIIAVSIPLEHRAALAQLLISSPAFIYRAFTTLQQYYTEPHEIRYWLTQEATEELIAELETYYGTTFDAGNYIVQTRFHQAVNAFENLYAEVIQKFWASGIPSLDDVGCVYCVEFVAPGAVSFVLADRRMIEMNTV